MTLSPAAIELSRRNLLAFTAATYPEYQIGWVHREICAKLMDFYVKVKRKQSPRLIITMPPRHGKSELVSRRFPAWCLGLDPNLSFISATYAADLAESMNSDVQKIINRGEYRQIFPWTTLQASRKKGEDTYKKTTTLFEIPGFRGGLRSAGVNGGINGQGADILSLDDLYKNRQEADSLTHRDSVMYWYTSTAYTRLAPGGGVLLTVTRWHEDDIVGRLVEMMKGGGDQWNIINYPAIAECDELHRKEGEALHPERYSVEALNRIRIAIGDYDFGSLYQQHPSPRGGSIFKRDRFMEWKTLPRIWDKIIQSWDCSFKEGKKNDYVAGQVWGKAGPNYYLLDAIREKMDFSGTKDAIRRMSKKWPQAVTKIVEDKANGPAIICELRKEFPGFLAYNPGADSKISRAYAITPYVDGGNIYLPPNSYGAAWKSSWIGEVCAFPNAAHDDQVDAFVQAILHFTHTSGSGVLSGYL